MAIRHLLALFGIALPLLGCSAEREQENPLEVGINDLIAISSTQSVLTASVGFADLTIEIPADVGFDDRLIDLSTSHGLLVPTRPMDSTASVDNDTLGATSLTVFAEELNFDLSKLVAHARFYPGKKVGDALVTATIGDKYSNWVRIRIEGTPDEEPVLPSALSGVVSVGVAARKDTIRLTGLAIDSLSRIVDARIDITFTAAVGRFGGEENSLAPDSNGHYKRVTRKTDSGRVSVEYYLDTHDAISADSSVVTLSAPGFSNHDLVIQIGNPLTAAPSTSTAQ